MKPNFGKEKIIAFIGYFWIVLSVAIAFWQLADFLFNIPKYTLSDYRAWLIVIAIVVGSILAALLLTRFFPSIIEVINTIIDRKQEETKFFITGSISEQENLTSAISSSLPYLEDEQVLLDSLKDACFGIKPDIEPNFPRAISIGKFNSKLFHHLGKVYLRILNGIFSLYALEKFAKDKKRREKYIYCKNFFIINDIGWGLMDLSKTSASSNEMEKLKLFLQNEVDGNNEKIYDIIKNTILNSKTLGDWFDIDNPDFPQKAKEIGASLIGQARDELEGLKKFPKLYAQAIRHSFSFETSREELLTTFNKVILTIKNKQDRAEMMGNMLFLQAYMTFADIKAGKFDTSTPKRREDQINGAIKNVQAAQEKYNQIGDSARQVKCYNLEGKLFLLLNQQATAKELFYQGLRESTNMQRYDQILLNLLSLVEMGEDKEKNARKGLSLAIKLKNREYELAFNGHIKTKHIFLIRHGESLKNIKKIISGEGPLTEEGRRQIEHTKDLLDQYIKSQGLSWEAVEIYGTEKMQIRETMKIIKENTTEKVFYENELLKPLDMGILVDKSESDNSEISDEAKNALVTLERWRNGMINAHELENNIPEIETFESYWGRAEKFIERTIARSETQIVIVVCTTSIAVILTQYLLNPRCTPEEYKCLDIPIGAVIHFSEIPDMQRYKLVNKDNRTNILYSQIDCN